MIDIVSPKCKERDAAELIKPLEERSYFFVCKQFGTEFVLKRGDEVDNPKTE